MILSVTKWCRKLARDHCSEVGRMGRRFEVEDLESEAFLAATEAAQYWHESRGVQFITFASAWIRTHLIAVTDPRLTPQGAGIEFPERIESREDGPEEIEDAKPCEVSRRLLGNLPEPTRTIVQLSVFSRLSPGRIAMQLGIPLKDIRLHLRNAGDRLKKASAAGDGVDQMIAMASV
jgi:RNA polymerase sigma factor (sigma-70 family)